MDFHPKRYVLYMGLLVVALIVAACGPRATPLPPTETPSPTATSIPPTPTTGPLVVPSGPEYTAKGEPFKGDADAPVILTEFSDYRCPACASYATTIEPILEEHFIATGKVRFIFKDFQFHEKAPKVAEAAHCAGEQGCFWKMREKLFTQQQEWSQEPEFLDIIRGYAEEMELDMAQFNACLDSGKYAAYIQASLEEGEKAGVGWTPAFVINGQLVPRGTQLQEMFHMIEVAYAEATGQPTPTPLPTIFDPNPERPGYTYGGDAFCGSEEAEVVLVEFVDFQSQDNQEFFLEEWPDLKEEFVETGKVRLIIKHFPAPEHTNGFKAAEAAECAGQQGAFCSMYDLLFQRQEEWSQAEDPSTVLKGYAAELELDTDAFATCLDEGQAKEKVKQDSLIAQRNQLSPAPQFFIFKGQRGGYVPRDKLQEALKWLVGE